MMINIVIRINHTTTTTTTTTNNNDQNNNNNNDDTNNSNHDDNCNNINIQIIAGRSWWSGWPSERPWRSQASTASSSRPPIYTYLSLSLYIYIYMIHIRM